MKRWKTAVFGSGFMGRVHVEALRRLGSVDLYGIADPDIAAARRIAAQFPAERVEEDYRVILSAPELDAVHICAPNALHLPIATAAVEAGKHVVCEKPLAVSVQEARQLVSLAARAGVRNCLNHNLRYYPMVQHMRRLREAGELGEIVVVQGTYSQDWLLYDTDWNWRVDSAAAGPSRCMADIGTHFFDMAEHVTGLRVSSLCADLQTLHKTRNRPKAQVETFAGKLLQPEDYEQVLISTEDFGAVVFRMGERTRGAMTASQISAGRKNRLSIELYGSKASVAWDQERPDELWMGYRNAANRVLVKDPSLLQMLAQPYADLPGGHSEGYDDTFKQVFRRFYASIENPGLRTEYPNFSDGLRQLNILDAVLRSNASRAWIDVPATDPGV